MTARYRDLFSFIPVALSFEFDGGLLEPVESLATARELVAEHERDGFFEPITVSGRCEPGSAPAEVARQPAYIYRLPPTHALEFDRPNRAQNELRHSDAAFVMHYIGFLLGVRCQFDGWWFDARLPLRERPDHADLSPSAMGDSVSQALRAWTGWPARQQRVITNALYLHGRAPSYHWDWERFQAEYQVLDALYSIAREVRGVVAKSHRDRIELFCNHLGLALPDPDYMRVLVSWRNDLVHETLWAGGQPGAATSDASFLASFKLHKLNRRAILALLGIRTSYIHTPWWRTGRFPFVE